MARRFIREWRWRAKLTQGELGETLGVSKSYVCRLESNDADKQRILTPWLPQLANALGCSVTELLMHPSKVKRVAEAERVGMFFWEYADRVRTVRNPR